jgi:flagellar basal-body rod protein FlgG
MIRALYASASGMHAQETLLDVSANNISNVNTNGFKRSHVDFADLLYSTVRTAGAEVVSGQQLPVGLQIGSGARAVNTTKLFKPGALEETGGSTDIAIEGNGFFKVLMPDGSFRYTRDGAFHIDSQGRLVNGDGYLVDGGITIPSNVAESSVFIGPGGNVSAVQNGATVSIGQLQLFRFPNPAGLSSGGGNLMEATPASGQEVAGTPGTDGLGTFRQGFLERSNVQVVTELISLITAQRAYEVNSRAIRAGDEMLSNTSQIIR